MYEITYRIEILKEFLVGVMAEYFQYEKDNEPSEEFKKNYERLKEIYSSILFVRDLNTLNELEKEIQEYRGYIDEPSLKLNGSLEDAEEYILKKLD